MGPSRTRYFAPLGIDKLVGWVLANDRRPTNGFFRCSILPAPRGAGREWESGRAVSSFRFPVSGFETRNTKLETDVRPDADQMRRLIGYSHHESVGRRRSL